MTRVSCSGHPSVGPRAAGIGPCMLGQQPVEAVGEHLALTLTQRSRAAGIDTAAAQFIQEIADRQPLTSRLAGIKQCEVEQSETHRL